MIRYIKFFIYLFLFASFWAEAKEKICLNMIVKNESTVITRCLDSVKPIIDYWVIVDTGSTDGTQEIIKAHMKDIPGELYERPWKNFGANRTEAIELAKGKGDFFLFMDADDWLEFEPNFQLPKLDKDLYHMWRTHGGGFSYLKAELARTSLPWKWVGVLHEYLDSSGHPNEWGILEGVQYVSGGDGARSHDPDKFLKHVKLLEDGLKEEPNNGRYVFYLAESYRDAGNQAKALEFYNKRIEMGGWEEETFWCMLQVANLTRDLGLPLDVVIDKYEAAHCFRPHRAEPLYFLAALYNQYGEYSLAYECLKRRDFISKPPNKDILFNMDWTETCGLPSQLAICCNGLGCYKEALDACNDIFSIKDLPEDWRQQAIFNRNRALEGLETLASSSKKTQSDPETEKTIFLSIIARNKAHVLPAFLKCIENLSYNKNLITIYVNTNDNSDNTQEILEAWIAKNKSHYQRVIFENHHVPPTLISSDSEINTAKIRNISLQKAKECQSDFYFAADCNVLIAPYTLKYLVKKDKPIIAPMLRGIPEPAEIQSTFFSEIDPNGYYKENPNYWRILSREIMGTIKVPLVHQVYLIKSEYIDKLSYTGNPSEFEFINFSRNARKRNVDQYVCNEKDFGAFFRVSKANPRLEEEVELFGRILAGELKVKFGLFPESPLATIPTVQKQDFLKGRIGYKDKRYRTFQLAFDLMKSRKVKTIVETGTARYGSASFSREGGSTILFADWASQNNGFFYSVDCDKESISSADQATLPYKNHIRLTQDDSIHFLQTFPQQIDFLYLDSLDFDADIKTSQEHILKEIEAAYDKLTSQSIVMINHCPLPTGGKGKLAIEFLTQRGWEIIAYDYQVILTKKSFIKKQPDNLNRTVHLTQKDLEEQHQAREIYSQALVHQAANELGKALSRFEKRTTLRGNPEETLWSWLKMAKIQEDLDNPPQEIIHSYNEAHRIFPSRVEPLYYLCCYYRKKEFFNLAYETALKGIQTATSHKESGFQWIRDYGILWEYSLCAWSIGNFDEAIEASIKLLNHPQTTDSSKFILNRNINYYRAGIQIFHFAKEKWGSPPWEVQSLSCGG